MDDEPPVMESRPTSAAIRRIRPLKGSFRYYPYTTTRTFSNDEKMKEEVVQLGVKLSLSVAESMFLLCDDIRTLLEFCFKIWRDVILYQNPVLERLLLVMHYVYSKDIKPKNGVYHDGGESVQLELIRTTWKYLAYGIMILHRLDMVLRRKVCSFDDRQLPSVIEHYKQRVLKKLENRLRSAKDVSEANGFARTTIESSIFKIWKPLFDEEATSQDLIRRVLSDLFTPILGWEIHALPVDCPFYGLGEEFAMQEVKEEVVRLGVRLSLCVAESMFLLCDDIRTLLEFCSKIWKYVLLDRNPVSERLLRVMHYVYSKDIKPKNGVYHDGGESVQWDLIRTSWKYFSDGIIILHRLDMALRKASPFDDRQLWSAIEKCKQEVLKKLEDKLRSVKDVSEANGFARKTIESNIFKIWKSLFDEEATSEDLSDMFTPLAGKPLRSEILALPVCSPYILGKDFALQEVKVEVVRLGVELSLYVAKSMFLLCDDIRSMLWFCNRVWLDAKASTINERHVMDRLLCVMHYVYTKYIEPKNGVYQNDGNESVQWQLVRTAREDLAYGFRNLNMTVFFLRGGGSCRRNFTRVVEERVKKVEETLARVKAEISDANGFVRDAMESNILDLWKSVYDKETEEATTTVKEIRNGIARDLFLPLSNDVEPA